MQSHPPRCSETLVSLYHSRLSIAETSTNARCSYCTNVFSVQVVDFDYTPIHKFIAVPRAEKCRKLIDFRIHLVGEPNWANLVEWVKRYHRGTGPFYHIPRREGNLVRPFLRGFFSMAQVMEGQDWPLVEKTMCAMRPALVALDPGWAT